MKVLKYRLWCTTDSVWEEVWTPDGDPAPTLCPTNSAHTVDGVLTSITGSTGGAAPVNDGGAPIQAPTFEDTGGLHPRWQGYLYNVTKDSTNIFDELVTTEKQLRGGWYEVMDANSVVGDYIEEAVVDKDDVLGLFATYGLTVGVDVLELKKYVKTEYINPLVAGQRQLFIAKSTFLIMAGLYTRIIYHSVGTVNDTCIKVTTLTYE